MTEAAVAIVPAHDEERSVAATVSSLRSCPEVAEVVVVADGCRDRTADQAAAAGARVLVTPGRLGKGGAVEFACDRLEEPGILLLVDADVGQTAAEAARLVRQVASGALDLAIGRLPMQPGGGMGVVKRLAGGIIRLLTGFESTAPLSGQRALTPTALQACRPLAAGFGLETAMTIDALRLGLRVGEIDVAMTHRATGRSPAGFAHRGRQGLDILRAAVPRALRLR